MTDAASTSTAAPVAAPDPRAEALRRVLADVATLAGQPDAGQPRSRASDLAVRVLQIDPASRALQQVSDALNHASLDAAARGLAAEIRASSVDAPHADASIDERLLRGALSDALRAPRPRGTP